MCRFTSESYLIQNKAEDFKLSVIYCDSQTAIPLASSICIVAVYIYAIPPNNKENFSRIHGSPRKHFHFDDSVLF